MRLLHIKYPFLISLRFWQQILFLLQKNLYWLFQIRSFYKIIFGSVRDDSLIEIKTKWIESLLCYIFTFVSTLALCILFFYLQKWLSYLSHVISPCLYGKLINWTNAFYLRFCCIILPRILNILLLLMNRVISIVCICQLYFVLFLM